LLFLFFFMLSHFSFSPVVFFPSSLT
jgi:hypothetical protein